MHNTIVGAGAASRYGSGSGSGFDQKMRLLAAPALAPQHCIKHFENNLEMMNFLNHQPMQINCVKLVAFINWL
jgi:hypothetical protein